MTDQNTDREALGRVVKAEYDKLPASRYPHESKVADAILASDWLAERDERVRREAAAEQREKDAQIAEQHGAPEPSRRFSPEHWDEWRERTSITIAAAIREQGTE